TSMDEAKFGGTMTVQEADSGASLSAQLRNAFSAFPTGVVAVCAMSNDTTIPVGMAVNSFSSISLDPPLVAISVAHTSRTWPELSATGTLGLSVLGSGQEHISRQLSARDGDRFDGVKWQQDGDGAVHIEGAALWLKCHLHHEAPGGDHSIILLAIDELHHYPEVEPLLFHQSR